MMHTSQLFVLYFMFRIVVGVELEVYNYAGAPVELYWLDKEVTQPTHSLKLIGLIEVDDAMSCETAEGHTFVVKYVRNSVSTSATFTKGPGFETVEVLSDAQTGNLSVYQDSLHFNELRYWQDKSAQCLLDDPTQGSVYKACMSRYYSERIKRIEKSRKAASVMQDKMHHHLRNYTCDDPSRQTSEPVSTYPFTYPPDWINPSNPLHMNMTVKVLFDEDNAKIWLIEDFVTPNECKVLEDGLLPHMIAASVINDNGTASFTYHRKAKNAGYGSHMWDYEEDPAWDLYERIITITNFHSRLNLSYEGQEIFTGILYGVGDEYLAHCDSVCDGSDFLPTARVATAIMYCQIPEQGGGTSFDSADIYIEPKKYAAVFFSYRGSDGKFDTGYTMHSGCPIRKGEKLVVTAWLRDGVSFDFPYTKTLPSGLPEPEDTNETSSTQAEG